MPPPSLKLPPARGLRRDETASQGGYDAAGEGGEECVWFQRAKGQALYGISTTNGHE
jgi:hypothetical protein